MRRRDFMVALSGVAAWPYAAHAQQKSMPVVGFLGTGPSDLKEPNISAFRQGLVGLGYIEGRTF